MACGVTGADTAPTSMVVSHASSPRRPTTTRGTTSVPPAGESSANANEPNATGPVPGSRTSSRTTACAVACAHAASASANRSTPAVLQLRGDAPGDEAVAAAHPGVALVGGQQVEEVGRQVARVHGDGASDQGSRQQLCAVGAGVESHRPTL